MFGIKKLQKRIKELEESVEHLKALDKRVSNLESNTHYLESFPNAKSLWNWTGYKLLTATDIINRFEELYKYLKIKREIVPSKPEEAVLKKEKSE